MLFYAFLNFISIGADVPVDFFSSFAENEGRNLLDAVLFDKSMLIVYLDGADGDFVCIGFGEPLHGGLEILTGSTPACTEVEDVGFVALLYFLDIIFGYLYKKILFFFGHIKC